MNPPTTHFAPSAPRGRLDAPPVISVTAMAGVSAMVRHAFGEKVLRQAKQAAMLDIELIEHHDCFIPQATMTGFLKEIERRAGEPHLGLLVAPHLSVTRYGRWGEYVLAADTLRTAIDRAVSTLGYHSTGDRMESSVDRGTARLSYFNAARGWPGYVHVACGSAGVMLSLFRSYLASNWLPRHVELDIPRPREASLFEEAFACPVVFDASAVSICFDAHWLNGPASRRPSMRLVTIEDVARSRAGPASLDNFPAVVTAQVWAQVLAGEGSIDSAARALDTSVRSLQRALHHHGTDFRELVNVVRVQRAKELLGGSQASITEISTELGYSAPANFARAFRKATGAAPQDFRRKPATGW